MGVRPMIAPDRVMIVVFGVPGSGRRRLARSLASAGGLAFVDSESFPGGPTEDIGGNQPRRGNSFWAWLDSVSAALADTATFPAGVVLSCPALRRADRDRIRWRASVTRFIYLRIRPDMLQSIRATLNKPALSDFLVEQFLSIECPQRDEADAAILDADLTGPLSAEA